MARTISNTQDISPSNFHIPKENMEITLNVVTTF